MAVLVKSWMLHSNVLAAGMMHIAEEMPCFLSTKVVTSNLSPPSTFRIITARLPKATKQLSEPPHCWKGKIKMLSQQRSFFSQTQAGRSG